MQNERLINLLKRTLSNVQSNVRGVGGELYLQPVSKYTSEDFFQKETSTLFRRYPLLIAHESQIPEPGFTLTHDALGIPLLVVRNKSREIKVFLNQCSHRSTRLIDGDIIEKRNALVCPYHNWVYNLDGDLINISQPESFCGLKKCDYGLVQVPSVVRHGFIWIQLDKRAPDLDHYLLGMGELLDCLELPNHICFKQSSHLCNANWKLIQDAFLESYHVHRLHRKTIGQFFLDNYLAIEREGNHLIASVARTPITEMADLPTEEWDLRSYVTLTFFLLPNTTMVFSPDYISVINLYPQSIKETIFTHTMLVPHWPESQQEREHWQRSFDLIDENVFYKEDCFISEQIQKGLKANGKSHLVIGDCEYGIRIFHDILDKLMAEYA